MSSGIMWVLAVMLSQCCTAALVGQADPCLLFAAAAAVAALHSDSPA
jgi:hypothetical protein